MIRDEEILVRLPDQGHAVSGVFEQDLTAGSRVSLPLIEGRASLLSELVAKSGWVAHIGCADAPYTQERLACSLHAQLLSVNRRVVGFDIDEQAIETLRAFMSEAEFCLADVAEAIPANMRARFDLVIAGEVLEHVSDAGRFLEGCGRLLSSNGLLCVTVPNACNPLVGMRSLLGREIVHPGHVAYYSPRTLAALTERHGFQTVSLVSCFREPAGSRRAKVLRTAVRLTHRVRGGPVGDGLIWVGRLLDKRGRGRTTGTASRRQTGRLSRRNSGPRVLNRSQDE